MTSNVSCRLPEPLAEQIDTAARRSSSLRSEVLRRAVRYYVKENPDDLPVLRDATNDTNGNSTPPNSEKRKNRSVYDPIDDL